MSCNLTSLNLRKTVPFEIHLKF